MGTVGARRVSFQKLNTDGTSAHQPCWRDSLVSHKHRDWDVNALLNLREDPARCEKGETRFDKLEILNFFRTRGRTATHESRFGFNFNEQADSRLQSEATFRDSFFQSSYILTFDSWGGS